MVRTELARRRANGENPNRRNNIQGTVRIQPPPVQRPVPAELPPVSVETATRWIMEIQRLPEPYQEGLLPRYWDLSRK